MTENGGETDFLFEDWSVDDEETTKEFERRATLPLDSTKGTTADSEKNHVANESIK